MTPDSIKKATLFLDSWLAYRMRQSDIVGCSVSILVDDEIIFSRVYGFANIEHKSPLTLEHLFHVASQTKMLTATAILQLAQKGALDLDEPIVTYLPWFGKHRDQRFRDITIRHLLSHSAGLVRDGLDSDYWLFKGPSPTSGELRKIITETGLVFAPGTGVKYSNLGFSLLGQIIEEVSNCSYATYVAQSILSPLGLQPMILDYTPKIKDQIPTGYGILLDRRRGAISERLPARGLIAATGLYATTEDMCRLVGALSPGHALPINDHMKHEMARTQQRLTGGYDQGTEFGLGLEIQTIGKRRVVGHSGHMAGHLTATYLDPKDKIVVSVASNTKDAPSTCMVRGIFGALDYFLHPDAPTNISQNRSFSVRLCNEVSTVEIVHNGIDIVAIDPDDWEPFAWYEKLEVLNDTTLRITTPGSIYNEGELLQYVFAGDAVESVRFAGLTMWPKVNE